MSLVADLPIVERCLSLAGWKPGSCGYAVGESCSPGMAYLSQGKLYKFHQLLRDDLSEFVSAEMGFQPSVHSRQFLGI